MTRVRVYLGLMAVSITATALSIASITIPRWLQHTENPHSDDPVHVTVGLYRKCSTAHNPPCYVYPTDEQCGGDERSFCDTWRTAGFLASFAVALHLVVLVAYLVLVNGGKRRREFGWKVLAGLMVGTAAVQFSIIGIVAYLNEHHRRFTAPGWYLDKSWVLSTVSASLTAGSAVALAASAFLLPPEGGYEFLDDPIEASEIFEWLSRQG